MSAGAPLSRKLAAELVGTFIFVLVGAGSALGTVSIGVADPASALLIAALANGLGLAMAVSATLAISGGVLNPAVTLGLLVGRKLAPREVVPYMLAELAGAIIACLALVFSFPASLGNPVSWGAPTLNLLSVWQGIAVEGLLTFVLVIAIYGTAVDPRAPRIGGIGIGLAVLADVLVGGPRTGAAMNPARAMGPMVSGIVAGLPFPSYWYIYWIGPILGAVAAGLVYSFVLESKQ